MSTESDPPSWDGQPEHFVWDGSELRPVQRDARGNIVNRRGRPGWTPRTTEETSSASGNPVPSPQTLPPATPPGLGWTVAITALFGLWGVLPAMLHSNRAQALGAPGGRYFKAFGLTLLVPAATWTVVLGLVVGGTIGLRPGGGSEAAAAAAGPATARQPSPEASSGASARTGQSGPAAASPTSYPTPGRYPSAAASPDAWGSQAARNSRNLSSGSWVTVLDSLSKTSVSESEATQRAAGLSGGGLVEVIDTDFVSGLNGGYWALVVTGNSSRSGAAGVCSSFNREVGGTCYPRQVG